MPYSIFFSGLYLPILRTIIQPHVPVKDFTNPILRCAAALPLPIPHTPACLHPRPHLFLSNNFPTSSRSWCVCVRAPCLFPLVLLSSFESSFLSRLPPPRSLFLSFLRGAEDKRQRDTKRQKKTKKKTRKEKKAKAHETANKEEKKKKGPTTRRRRVQARQSNTKSGRFRAIDPTCRFSANHSKNIAAVSTPSPASAERLPRVIIGLLMPPLFSLLPPAY